MNHIKETARPAKTKRLRSDIRKIIDMLQEKDLVKFFKACLDYDFIFKNGNIYIY